MAAQAFAPVSIPDPAMSEEASDQMIGRLADRVQLSGTLIASSQDQPPEELSMPVQIPADVTIVTLRNGGQELPQRWTGAYARSVLESASSLLQDRADIEFRLGACELVVEEMPAGARADMVDDPGYHFLAAAHRAGTGVRVILVDRVSRPELGGEAREKIGICLIAYASDMDSTGRMLAHELGHLLALPHVDDARRRGPGQERQVAAWMRNLMYSGALNPAAELTPTQVQQARSSSLARRFGAR